MSTLLDKYLYFFDNVKAPIMLVGVHGCGKSQLLDEYALYRNFNIINVRASLLSEVDVIGFPKDKGEELIWDPPYWMKEACARKTIIFLDEINRASAPVRNGLFQLCDSRRIGANVLHPESRIFGAINPDTEKYFVNPFDGAERDRWFWLDFKPEVSDWLSWARDHKVFSIVIDFINSFNDELDPKPNEDVSKKGPSRRSWTRLSNALNSRVPVIDKDLERLVRGFVGDEVSVGFIAYFKSHYNQVNRYDYLDRINDESITLQELQNCFMLGDEFWNAVVAGGALRKLLISVTLQNSLEFYEVFKDAVTNIIDPNLYKSVIKAQYQKGFNMITFSQDMAQEEEALKMSVNE